MVHGVMIMESETGEPVERRFGARRDDMPGHPFEWVFDIAQVARGYQVKHQNPWEPTGDVSRVQFRATDITFEKDSGGDMTMGYRCRALGTRRLICLNAKGAAWDGREFTKAQ